LIPLDGRIHISLRTAIEETQNLTKIPRGVYMAVPMAFLEVVWWSTQVNITTFVEAGMLTSIKVSYK
jgi:hypothetical protein